MMEITVVRPWEFVFLLPAVLFCLFRLKSVQAWLGVVDAHLIESLLVKTAARLKERFSALFLILCVASVAAALAGVSVRDGQTGLYHPKSPAVIVLDMSLSMKVKDVSPNRFSQAIFKVYDLLEELKGVPVAFIVFTDEPYPLIPVTTDKNVVENILPLLNFSLMPSQGTRTDRAMEEALRAIKETGADYGDVFLITDGGENVWEVQEKTESIVKSASLSRNRLFILGVGSPEGGLLYEKDDQPVRNALGGAVNHRLKEGYLKRLAEAGKGMYARVQADNSDIAALMRARKKVAAGEKSSVDDPALRDTGYWFLILPLIGFPFLFPKGRLLVFVLSFLTSFPARADIADAFLSPSAAAMRKLENNASKEAVSIALNSNDFMALYNVGTKLIFLRDYPTAVRLLEKAVLLRPDNENARINLEIARRLNENDSEGKNGNGGSDQGDSDENNEESDGGDNLNQNDKNDPQHNENKENNSGDKSSEGENGDNGQGDGKGDREPSGGDNDDRGESTEAPDNQSDLLPVHEDPLTLLRHKILLLHREKRYNRDEQIGVQW